MIEEQLKKQAIKQGFIKKKKGKDTNQENSDPIIASQLEASFTRSNSVSDTERKKLKKIGKNTVNFAITEEESVCKSEGSPEKQLKKTRTFKQLVK
jgi:hypothetical protein